MKPTRRKGRARLALSLSAGALALAGTPVSAQVVRDAYPDRQRGAERRLERGVASSWTVAVRGTYTDNYRRLPDTLTRRYFSEGPDGNEVLLGTNFVVDPETGGPAFDPDTGEFVIFDPDSGEPPVDPETGEELVRFVAATDPVAIEPLDNRLVTASLNGGTVYERPGLTGVVTGGVSVSAYLDEASPDERLSDALATPIPDGSLPVGVSPSDVTRRSFGLNREEDLVVRPNISGSATARLYEDLFYLDASALATQQTFSRRNDIARNADGRLGDSTTFVGGSVSPYLLREVGVGGSLEARYRFSSVLVAQEEFDELGYGTADEDEVVLTEGLQFANDTVAHEVVLEYLSGTLLDRFTFGARTSAARSDETGSDLLPEVELSRASVAAEVGYVLTQTYRLTGELGYDEVDIDQTASIDAVFGDGVDGSLVNPLQPQALSDDASGVFWFIGAEGEPNPRTEFSVAIGQRFGGVALNGEVTYRPSPRFVITGEASRSLTTGGQAALLNYSGGNARTLQIVNQLAGTARNSSQRLLDRALAFQGAFSTAQSDTFGVAARDEYRLNASYTSGRTQFRAGADVSGAVFGGGRGNDRYALTAGANRRVTRRVSVGANLRYQHFEGRLPIEFLLGDAEPDTASTDQVFLSANASYQIGRRLAATASAYRIDSSGGGRSLAYEENAVSAGLSWSF